jgi:sterol carrier protein 2
MSDGAAAATLVSESFLGSHPQLKGQAVEIVGQCLATDGPRSYDETAMNLVGFDMTQHAAQVALSEAELSIKDIKVVELHDCFSTNEILAIDALGLSAPSRAHEYVRNG